MYTIDIDTGGTCTDGFFSREGEFKTAKVLTTPHDLTVCLAECIKEGAKLFDISVPEMLANTDVVRYSTTTGVNALITKSGAKIGLIVSSGYKETLYAENEDRARPVHDLLSDELIAEVNEAVDETGKILTPIQKDEILDKMQYLIDMGARAIVVSLKNSHVNPMHEKTCKNIIKDQYPNYFLGSIRVFLASEISDQPGDFSRTNTVVANGYIHDILVKYLYKAEDDLRAKFHPHPLMVAHSHGGVARVAKTRAIDTYSSGPALGVIGARKLGQTYGFGNVITVDIGGTSLDIGLIKDGEYHYEVNPEINGFPISVPMITTYSAPVASGSIAWVDADKKLRIGPKSAGARPGPVCFDMGGMEPTVTDADVVLGFIDPDYFLGGKLKLNRTKAENVIRMKVAARLGIDVAEAAWRIREEMARVTIKEIETFAQSYGIKKSDFSNFTMVVYGGAGPTHYGDFIQALEFGHSIATPYASVFSAFGSSTTDLLHSYSNYITKSVHQKEDAETVYKSLKSTVEAMIETARKDIRGEGFSPDSAEYAIEFTDQEGTGDNQRMVDFHIVRSEADISDICGKLVDNLDKVSNIVVEARIPMPHVNLKTYDMADISAAEAIKGKRPVFWSPEKGYQETKVYSLELLVPGNMVPGPAVVEGVNTNYVVPEKMFLKVDQYSNIIMLGSK